MKLCVSALLLILVPALVTGHASQCKIDESVKSFVSKQMQTPKLECNAVTARSSYSTCPQGFIVTGCSCGMGCGSWDVQGLNTCHCQCQNMDWTTAVCCRTILV